MAVVGNAKLLLNLFIFSSLEQSTKEGKMNELSTHTHKVLQMTQSVA